MKKFYSLIVSAALMVTLISAQPAEASTPQQSNTDNRHVIIFNTEWSTFLSQRFNIDMNAWLSQWLNTSYSHDAPEQQSNKEAKEPQQQEPQKNTSQQEPTQEKQQPEPETEAQPPEQNNRETEQQSKQQTEAKYTLNEFEQRVVELTNQERVERGLQPLKIDFELSHMARVKARDMRDNQYFSHQSPKYGSPFDMMRQFGIDYTAAGENIAAGQTTPQEVVNAWMNSPGHRRNILNENYTHIGVGYVSGGSYGHYWVQEFIRK